MGHSATSTAAGAATPSEPVFVPNEWLSTDGQPAWNVSGASFEPSPLPTGISLLVYRAVLVMVLDF